MKNNQKSKLQFIIFDLVILFGSFLIFAWIKPGTKSTVLPNYLPVFLVFSFIWLAVSFLIGKYNALKKNLSGIIYNLLKNGFICIALLSIIFYALNIFQYSRLIVFGTIGLSTIIQIFGIFIYKRAKYRNIKGNSTNN